MGALQTGSAIEVFMQSDPERELVAKLQLLGDGFEKQREPPIREVLANDELFRTVSSSAKSNFPRLSVRLR